MKINYAVWLAIPVCVFPFLFYSLNWICWWWSWRTFKYPIKLIIFFFIFCWQNFDADDDRFFHICNHSHRIKFLLICSVLSTSRKKKSEKSMCRHKILFSHVWILFPHEEQLPHNIIKTGWRWDWKFHSSSDYRAYWSGTSLCHRTNSRKKID